MSIMWGLSPFGDGHCIIQCQNRRAILSDMDVAIRRGETPKIWSLIKSGVLLRGLSHDDSNLRLLIQNCEDRDLIQHFLQFMCIAEINYIGNIGTSALSTAASRGNIEVIELLVQAKADVNLCDSEGETALHKVRSIIYSVVPPNSDWSPMHEKALKTAQLLIRLGAFVDGNKENVTTPLVQCLEGASLTNIPLNLITYLVSEGAKPKELPAYSMIGRYANAAIQKGLAQRKEFVETALRPYISDGRQLVLDYFG